MKNKNQLKGKFWSWKVLEKTKKKSRNGPARIEGRTLVGCYCMFGHSPVTAVDYRICHLRLVGRRTRWANPGSNYT